MASLLTVLSQDFGFDVFHFGHFSVLRAQHATTQFSSPIFPRLLCYFFNVALLQFLSLSFLR